MTTCDIADILKDLNIDHHSIKAMEAYKKVCDQFKAYIISPLSRHPYDEVNLQPNGRPGLLPYRCFNDRCRNAIVTTGVTVIALEHLYANIAVALAKRDLVPHDPDIIALAEVLDRKDNIKVYYGSTGVNSFINYYFKYKGEQQIVVDTAANLVKSIVDLAPPDELYYVDTDVIHVSTSAFRMLMVNHLANIGVPYTSINWYNVYYNSMKRYILMDSGKWSGFKIIE